MGDTRVRAGNVQGLTPPEIARWVDDCALVRYLQFRAYGRGTSTSFVVSHAPGAPGTERDHRLPLLVARGSKPRLVLARRRPRHLVGAAARHPGVHRVQCRTGDAAGVVDGDRIR